MQTSLAGILLCLAAGSISADEPFPLRDGQRVLFLGDSITQAGQYVSVLDTYLFTRHPDRRIELISLGLASETASGLSEDDHPFPRPHVHERLGRALEKVKPDVVVACYGMNDGIYSPPDDGRARAYREGIETLVRLCRDAGAAVVLMTPPPFDPVPIADTLAPPDAKEFGYRTPYRDYDRVLDGYAEFVRSFRGRGVLVADPRAAFRAHLDSARGTDPTYTLSGDGIHPNAIGHWLIARELLRAWGATGPADTAVIDWAEAKALAGRVTEVRRAADDLAFVWEARSPMPVDPAWRGPTDAITPLGAEFNRLTLTVANCPEGHYEIREDGRVIGWAYHRELRRGVDLAELAGLSIHARRADVSRWADERRKLIQFAWLSHVGHRRPGVPKGLPLGEATAKAAEIETRIRESAGPVALKLRVVPAGCD